METGSVTCNLCNAMINVKMGNFYKYQLHMENDHDVFHDQDLLMALTFLEVEEKEVIITNVLPRMKELLDAAVILTEKKALNSPFLIHQKLSEYEASKEESKNVETINDDSTANINNGMNNVASTSKIEIQSSQIIEQNADTKKLKIVEVNDKVAPKNVAPKLTPKSVKKEATNNKIKLANQDLAKTPVQLECPVCKEMVKKYKFNMHKNNCIIMQRLRDNKKRLNNTKSISNKNDEKEKDEKVETSSNVAPNMKQMLPCYYCDKKFSLKSSLERHKMWSHTTE